MAPNARRVARIAVLGLAGAASVWIFLAVDSRSHSVSDAFSGAVVPIGLVWAVALVVLAVLARLGRTMADP